MGRFAPELYGDFVRHPELEDRLNRFSTEVVDAKIAAAIEGSSGGAVISVPLISGPTTARDGTTITLTASATSLLVGGSIASFTWTLPDGSTQTTPAVSGSASINVAVSGTVGETKTVSVKATDNAANQSQSAAHVFAISDNSAPDVTNLTTNIPASIRVGETLTNRLIAGATDPDGDTVTYTLFLPVGLTASKTTGINNNEPFSLTAAPDMTVGATVTITIAARDGRGGEAQKLISLAIAAAMPDTPVVGDVFKTSLYTGNGSTQTINNGIDLAGNGGLVWIKGRNADAGYHRLFDTSRGATNYLDTATSTSQSIDDTSLMAFSSNGFSLSSAINVNRSGGYNYASWTFRKAPKFFDVVTYTGDGTSNRQIPHSLGVAPGMIVVKRADSAGSWRVYHTGIGANKVIFLEATQAAVDDTGGGNFAGTSPTASVFSLGAATNQSGGVYVAYLFAHDPSAEGIIQCGVATAGVVNLGWEPQFLIYKREDSIGNWGIRDNVRGMLASGNSQQLFANTSDPEVGGGSFNVTSNGFDISGIGPGTYIYLAIRKPA